MLLTTTRFRTPEQIEAQTDMLADIRKKSSKPVMAILSHSFSPGEVEQAGDIMQRLQGSGVPTFLGLERGAGALKKALDYYRLNR